jgi:hypothetical protein
MTVTRSSTGPGGAAPSPLPAMTVNALQDALAAEHAALWCYALVVAFLPAEQLTPARADAAAHRELRATLERILSGAGMRAVTAEPAYATPQPVTDGPSAAGLAAVAESDGLGAWKSVLEHTSDRTLRRTALTVLTEGTLRSARWRAVLGTQPAVPPFPGRP